MATDVIKFYWDKTSLLPYEPDILASQRYLKSYRRVTPAEPEKVLLFAVLAEAVETFQRFAFSEAPHKRRLFRRGESMVLGAEIQLSFLISEHLRGLRSRSGLSTAGAQAMDCEFIM